MSLLRLSRNKHQIVAAQQPIIMDCWDGLVLDDRCVESARKHGRRLPRSDLPARHADGQSFRTVAIEAERTVEE